MDIYQAFWGETPPLDPKNSTAEDDEPVGEVVDEYEMSHLMVRLRKTAGMERRKPKRAPRARPQSTSILDNSATVKVGE